MSHKWQHIYPINDIEEHEIDIYPVIDLSGYEFGEVKIQWTDGCKCKPIVDHKDHLIIHNAFDCREAIEEANRILHEA